MASDGLYPGPRLQARVSDVLCLDLENVLVAYATSLLRVFPRELVGIYLYGSVTHGAYVPGSSDIDVAVLHRFDLTREQRGMLAAMHERLGGGSQALNELDVSYAPLRLVGAGGEDSLPFFRDGVFHHGGGGDVNTVLWKSLRERGVAVWGNSPRKLVPPVSQEEVDAEMWVNLAFLRRRMPVYAACGTEETVFGVLSICRVLHTLKTGALAGKTDAARWAVRNLSSRWSGLIQQALERYQHGNFSGQEILFRARAVVFSCALTDPPDLLWRRGPFDLLTPPVRRALLSRRSRSPGPRRARRRWWR